MRGDQDYYDKLAEPARTSRKPSKRGGSPNVKGCPANDGKEHVYAHVMYRYKYLDGREGRESHLWGPCIGCGHRHRKKWTSKPTGEPDVIHDYVLKKNESLFSAEMRHKYLKE